MGLNHYLTVGQLREVIKDLPYNMNVVMRSDNGEDCKDAHVHIFPAKYNVKKWSWDLIDQTDGEHVCDPNKLEFKVLSFD